VPTSLRRGVPVVQPRAPDGEAGEGLEVPLVERRVSRRDEGLHGADERGNERPRNLRSDVRASTFNKGARQRIR